MKTSIITLLTALLLAAAGPSSGREVTDMAGRKVVVPDSIAKVYSGSPPSTYITYAIGPDLLAGFNYSMDDEKKYLHPSVRNLPVVGGWFGQGMTPNIEAILKQKPDVVALWRWSKPLSTDAKTEETLKMMGLPVVYLKAQELSEYPAAFRFLGKLVNREKRGEELARHTEKALSDMDKALSDAKPKPRVYYAEGVDGLSTECEDSEHAALIRFAKGDNVHKCSSATMYGMEKVSIEQVMLYDPEVILVKERAFFDRVYDDPRWKGIRAVRDKKIYLIPRLPFNWFDRPPSFMRILGLKWLAGILHPEAVKSDMVRETRDFYRLFIGIDISDEDARSILNI